VENFSGLRVKNRELLATAGVKKSKHMFAPIPKTLNAKLSMKTTLAWGMMAGILSSLVMGQVERGPEEPMPPREGDRRRHLLGKEEMFKRMDRDGDGKITKSEFFASPRIEQLSEEQRNAFFGRLDRDEDGSISGEEIRMLRQQAERRARDDFRKLDVDENGSVNFEEFSKGKFISKLPEEKRRQIFSRMDTDGNGVIDGADRPKGPPGKPEMRPERKQRD
jgi:Ca2+-binding EF-hand superfamily protein